MQGYERRERGEETGYKADAYDPRIGAWRPLKGRREYRTEAECRASLAGKPGRYRIVRFQGGKATEGAPFDV